MACAGNSIRADLPIPTNISRAVIPGRNISAAPMVACCSPNPVRLIDDCYEWCELPDKYERDEARALDAFGSCLSANGRNLSVSNILGVKIADSAAARPVVTVAGLGVWGLLASALLVLT
ncbi:hypothetical protein CTA2_7309 [Colletotrichum tanaceti]|uniref:Uncharacterized protein n=1 Tax=Colletotrichum tanaceti TaxID=1306861 RepID=A0A4U6XSS9_9PEZI|nr:hypothetical protein CTA2_7309 [Colletotrichum tanaceti]TKW58819.1 hypothetical protein CTA1_8632 [Colletotrichum tanaceti]